MPCVPTQDDLRSIDQRDLDDLRDIALGDRVAFARLVSRYERPVLHLARALCAGQRDSADDVLQDTFLSVFQGAHTFRADGSPRAWILTIARHAAAKHLRHTPPPAPSPDPDDATSLASLGAAAGWGEAASPEQLTSDAEQRAALQRALLSLDDTDRLVIGLRDLQGLSGPEAAALAGLPLNTLKTRLHRARLRLMVAMRAGGSPHGS
jgi:RNA polymerase sigma-70 factor, ECF subfamily